MATKSELLRTASGLGIDVAGKTKEQLEAAIEQSAGENTEAHKPANTAAPVKAKKGQTVARVVKGGEVIRTYTKSGDGDAFIDYANQYASKEEGRSVETDKETNMETEEKTEEVVPEEKKDEGEEA